MSVRVTESLDDGRTTFADPASRENREAPTEKAQQPQLTDPVCGMYVDSRNLNTAKLEKDGSTYYFCSQACKAKFDKNPEEFISNT